jgi:exoribonuclease II
MDSNRTLEMTNLEALIGLWQQEERRLHAIIDNPLTSSVIRGQANERLTFVIKEIEAAIDEMTHHKP